MINSDADAYPVELLHEWKKVVEDEQIRIINQGESFLTKKDLSEGSRKMVAYREIKRTLDNLHSSLQLAYDYWSCNFKIDIPKILNIESIR